MSLHENDLSDSQARETRALLQAIRHFEEQIEWVIGWIRYLRRINELRQENREIAYSVIDDMQQRIFTLRNRHIRLRLEQEDGLPRQEYEQ